MTALLAPARLLGAGHGPLPQLPPDRLIDLVREAGLTGHGGAGFPTHRKLATVRSAGATGRAVVVGNGAEGEPASAKDRTLLLRAPHLVLDGLQLAAAAVGAAKTWLYVPAATADRLAPVVAERRATGRDRVPVRLHRAPDTFLAGEESAVVAAVNGRPALPRDKFRRVTESGVGGAPTLVQNVETLAHLTLIARHGSGWFRRAGTFLATVSGPVLSPGVHELPHGVTLGELLAAAGGPAVPLQMVLVGGFHGAWVPPRPDLPISRAALAPYDASPGAGVVIALAAGRCGLMETARIVDYLSRESAHQCGPCLNGLPRLAATMTALARGKADATLPAGVARLTALVTGRGACSHPDGTTRLIRSALTMFADDVTAHLSGRCLTAGGAR